MPIKIRSAGLALLLAGLLALAGARSAWADPLIHIVQPGENLFRIGLKYGVSWQAIMQANGLTSIYIYVGQQLVIPGASAPAATPAPIETPLPGQTPPPTETPPPVDTPPAAETPAPALTHIVRPGETLGALARRYNVGLAELAAANNILNPSIIYVGQTLVIPSGAAPAQPTPLPAGNGPKRIEVDISEQRLYAYAGDVLVFSFVASTGEPGRDTAPGTYTVLNKIPNAYASLWNLQMPNWLGIYWVGKYQNGIHALPILSNGRRLWEGYLGMRVSYGCVIVGVAESQLLYDWAEVGTQVIIRW